MRRNVRNHLDPQLAYLVELTRHGLKPLSRWEGPLDKKTGVLIESKGLKLDTITRRTRIGRKVPQTVFARSGRAVELYRRRFHDSPLRHTPEEIRSEGWFFGYPSCCVDAFIRRPYMPNNLAPEDQKILFHWACPDCVVTPGLLAEYRSIYTQCRKTLGSGLGAGPSPRLPRLPRILAPVAASLALAAGGVAANPLPPDPHWLPAADDADLDYLSVKEEILAGTIWDNPDTDGDGILDGVQVSQRLRQLIEFPPPGVTVEYHYIQDFEPCLVCGMPVDMGFVGIIHQARGLEYELHFIALHYLECGCQCGCLEYQGGMHQGRVDLDAAKRILFACDPAHLLPLSEYEDPDMDGLVSEEEPPLRTDPSDPDSDGDSLIDGPQVAEEFLPILADLPRYPDLNPSADAPYMVEMWMYGLETCQVCGGTFNMGYVKIVNPAEELFLDVPFVGVHSLAHGGHGYRGTENEGRVLPVLLRTVLTGNGTAHWLPVVGDGDGDGLTNEEELRFGMDPEDPDENGDFIPDGRAMAVEDAATIHELPEGPLPDQVYVIHHYTFGFYNCLTCGEGINMGFAEIVNPMSGASVDVPYYNLHFMDRGSYSTDREDLYPRVDPYVIAQVLYNNDPSGAPGREIAAQPRFWNAPNPFSLSGRTEVALNVPEYAGEAEVSIYDAEGRCLRSLFTGRVNGDGLRVEWDGRDDGGTSVSPGTYFCRVKLGTLTLGRKITVTR